jgi:hypothetical protein
VNGALIVVVALAAALAPLVYVTVTNRKLDVIHALVNSNMTAHMQSELEATVRELAMMREVSRLHDDAGRAPTSETIQAIEMTEAKVAELRAVLEDRFKTQDASDPPPPPPGR